MRPGRYDNSFKAALCGEAFIDLAVFAGTPEWASPRLKLMYDYIARHAIPTVYLGIGSADPDFTLDRLKGVYRRVLSSAKLITVRDRACGTMLRPLPSVFLPCPAFVAAPPEYERNIGGVANIGLIFSGNTGVKYNKISDRAYRSQVELYRGILRHYAHCQNVEFVCHYIDELPLARREFGGWKCNYSYDAEDYLGIYNKFDLVIGPRVHGIGLAASMGIPGIHLRTDLRGGTCEKFCAVSLAADSGVDRALGAVEQRMAVADKINKEILQRKHEAFREYYRHLLPILSDAGIVRHGLRLGKTQESATRLP